MSTIVELHQEHSGSIDCRPDSIVASLMTAVDRACETRNQRLRRSSTSLPQLVKAVHGHQEAFSRAFIGRNRDSQFNKAMRAASRDKVPFGLNQR